MIIHDPIVRFYSLLRQHSQDSLQDASVPPPNIEETTWNAGLLFREILSTHLQTGPILLVRQIIEQSTQYNDTIIELVKQILEAHKKEYCVRLLNELITHPNDSANIALTIGVDSHLDQKNFKKPLLQGNIQDLPTGTEETHYRNIISTSQDLLDKDKEKAKIIGRNGSYKTGLYLWVDRLDRKSAFAEDPSLEPSEDCYVKLTKLVNHLTLFLESPHIPLEGKREILFRLSEASGFCATRWMTEAETMYRELRHESSFQSTEEWVQCHDELFRRKLIHELVEGGDVHELQQYLFHVQMIINIPGGTESLREPYQKHSILRLLSNFFKKYTSQKLVKHFLALANGPSIDTINKFRLIDWFGGNIPELYKREDEEREYAFLSEVMYEENSPDRKYKSGDFTENGISYLLYKCGILRVHKWVSLHAAAGFGYPEIARDLLRKGIDANISDQNGVTPLRLAAQNGHLEVVKHLIEWRAPINGNCTDKSPLYVATYNGHLAIVKYLVECGAAISPDQKDGWSPLHAAAGKGYLDIVKYLVMLGAMIDLKQKDGWSPLHLAAKNGHFLVVKYLIEKKVLINANQKDGWSPLHVAAQNGHLEIVQYLVNLGAFIHPNQKDGWMPLHMAVQEGLLGVAKYLINMGASIEIAKKDGRTSLHMAAENGYLEIVKYLVKSGASVNSKENDGVTPLHMAARRDHLEIVQHLLNSGADINVKNKHNWTPLHMAACSGSLSLVEYLLSQGASIDIAQKSDWTPLSLAVYYGRLDIVQYLLKMGAPLQKQDGFSPLHTAAQTGRITIAKYLVSQGASINAIDQNGLTPLHEAAENNHLEIVKYLMSCSADHTIKDKDGMTPYALAIKNNHLETAKYLLERRGWLQSFLFF